MKASIIVPRLAIAALVFAFASTATNAQAGAFFSGDLVVYRVGTGSGGLGSTATAVFLDEYTPLGTLVQSIALPTTGSAALTAVGNDTTEGIMSLAQNGPMVIFTGYRANVGSANPSASTPDVVNRVVGTVEPYGFVNTSVAVTDVSGTVRSAASTDGSSLFYVGASTGLGYVGSPSGASTSVQIDSRNIRQTVVSGGNMLFASSTKAGDTFKIENYGTLPTTPTAGSVVVADDLDGCDQRLCALRPQSARAGRRHPLCVEHGAKPASQVHVLMALRGLQMAFSPQSPAWRTLLASRPIVA